MKTVRNLLFCLVVLGFLLFHPASTLAFDCGTASGCEGACCTVFGQCRYEALLAKAECFDSCDATYTPQTQEWYDCRSACAAEYSYRLDVCNEDLDWCVAHCY